MFTGIVKGKGIVKGVEERPGLVTFTITLPKDSENGLEIGASVAVDGVCLTTTKIVARDVSFDVMQETLIKTTIGSLKVNSEINIERAAKDGAEIGGHPLSGHVDTKAELVKIEEPINNYVLTFKVDPQWIKYIFPKGYVALNGTSLTIAAVDKKECTFTAWLIPETLRLTTFGTKKVGDYINLEVERGTLVTVDTIRDFLEENLVSILQKIPKSDAPFLRKILE